MKRGHGSGDLTVPTFASSGKTHQLLAVPKTAFFSFLLFFKHVHVCNDSCYRPGGAVNCGPVVSVWWCVFVTWSRSTIRITSQCHGNIQSPLGSPWGLPITNNVRDGMLQWQSKH